MGARRGAGATEAERERAEGSRAVAEAQVLLEEIARDEAVLGALVDGSLDLSDVRAALARRPLTLGQTRVSFRPRHPHSLLEERAREIQWQWRRRAQRAARREAHAARRAEQAARRGVEAQAATTLAARWRCA